MYDKSTSNKQDFLLVDMEAEPEDRFRKNFKEIFDLGDNDKEDEDEDEEELILNKKYGKY